MGLRMYQDPDAVTVDDNIAKVERAAATRRSTIRREPSVRSRRYAPADVQASRDRADPVPDRQRPHRSPFVDANDEIQHLEAELEQFRHRILTQTRRGTDRNTGLVAPQDIMLNTSNTSDPINHLSRESALRFALGPRAYRDIARSGTTSPRHHRISRDSWVNRRTLPSPPLSIESSGRVRAPRGGRSVIPDGPLDVSEGFTRDFAPAQAVRSRTPQPSAGMSRVVVEHNVEGQPAAVDTLADTPPAEVWEASYPPLRRVGRLSPRLRASYDGLGDRRRSMSPGSPSSRSESVVNEDHWETLLTTINDETFHPQASFDSTRSNSEPDSNPSTQTAATSFGEIGSADDTCDLDLPQGITESDVREIRERNRSNQNEMRGPGNAVQYLRQRRENQADPSGEMAMFQSLLIRLAQREDIPTEWWSAAGLARTVGENV